MLHSPRMTRSQSVAALGAESEARRTTTSAGREDGTEVQTLQTVLEELRQLREERERERREFSELRQELRSGGRRQAGPGGEESQGQSYPNFKLKPDIFNGDSPFYEYVAQFELIARASVWAEEEKALIFAANLRGKARSVLEGMGNNFTYEQLKSKLELRFGEKASFQNYYVQLTNRKIRAGEDFATFGGDLERLVRLTYPECTADVQNKIACAQFVTGLAEGFVKQTLQLEGVISLRTAIERAKVVSTISKRENCSKEQNYEEREGSGMRGFNKSEGTVNFRRRQGVEFARNTRWIPENRWKAKQEVRERNIKWDRERKYQGKECWQCGSEGHFRAECPALINKQLK